MPCGHGPQRQACPDVDDVARSRVICVPVALDVRNGDHVDASKGTRTAPPRTLFDERATHDFPIVVPVALICMQLLSGGHPLLTFSTQASYAFHSGLKAWARVADTSFDLSDYKVS